MTRGHCRIAATRRGDTAPPRSAFGITSGGSVVSKVRGVGSRF